MFVQNVGKLLSKKIFIALGGVIVVNAICRMLPEFLCDVLSGRMADLNILTFQDIMWLTFFIAIQELLEHNQSYKLSLQEFEDSSLVTDPTYLIDRDEVGNIIMKYSSQKDNLGNYSFNNLVYELCVQFKTNNSMPLALDFLNTQIENIQAFIALKYSSIRYYVWVIPTFGFMGTVFGISQTVSSIQGDISDSSEVLSLMASNLGVAFNTTLLALILSAILQFVLQKKEEREERLIVNFSNFLLVNIVNKFIESRPTT